MANWWKGGNETITSTSFPTNSIHSWSTLQSNPNPTRLVNSTTISNLQTTTFSTLIQNFSQRLHLSEPSHHLINDPKLIQCKAITQYYNSRNSIYLPYSIAGANRYVYPGTATSLISYHNMLRCKLQNETQTHSTEKSRNKFLTQLNQKCVLELLERYYDYSNPYGCEFCNISVKRQNNKTLEMSEQILLLSLLRVNPFELTDGIRKILAWPWEKCTNNLSDVDGLTSLRIDEQHRKIKELFPNIVMEVQENPSENWLEFVPTQDFEFVFEEEIRVSLRNRMAEFVCIGPLNHNWYAELLNAVWSEGQNRMPYIQNFDQELNLTGQSCAYFLTYRVVDSIFNRNSPLFDF